MLLSADPFAVLGSSAVTSTGGTVLNGDLGIYPGSSITGFGPGIVNGATYLGGSVAQQARIDTQAAFTSLGLEPVTADLTGQDLGGLTLGPGVRTYSSSAQLTGTLILDGQGVCGARFDFLIGSTLTTASSASVVLINGAQADNVFWQVGSSATLGTDTAFIGSILAETSITLNTRASLLGRALAINGAVTLDDNLITVPPPPVCIPEPASVWAGALCAALMGAGPWMAAWRRRAPAA